MIDLSFSKDKRRNARIVLLQEIFWQLFTERYQVESSLPSFKEVDYDQDKYQALKKAVSKNSKEADQLVIKFAPERPLNSLNPVDLAILRIIISEAFLSKITPAKAAINEGIEIAKMFGGEASSRFINGVLGSIYKLYESTDDKFPK